MDYFEEPVDEYTEADEFPASEYSDSGYAAYEDYEEAAEYEYVYADEELVRYPSNNLLDYLRGVSMSLPVAAVIFIGLGLVFLTSYINYDQAEQFVNAQNYSTAVTSLNQPPSEDLLAPPQDDTGSDALPALFAREVLYWQAEIMQWASEQGVDARLAATVMQIESCGHPKALSRAGAMGLFQVMPYHFQMNEDGFDPSTNALRGLAYLRQALNAHQGDARLALAGYNAGIAGSSRPENNWPAETKRYVYWGTGIYADALAGSSYSARLEEWLNAGGRSLCAQASQALELP